MADVTKFRQKIEDYLLNKSSEETCQEIEKRFLTDGEFYDFFLTVECDLYEKYLESDYSPSEKESFEKYFLAHPQRQEDLWLTRSLKEKAKNNVFVKEATPQKDEHSRSFNFRKVFPILAPIFTILLLAIGSFIWWNYSQNSDLNKGLASFKKAYGKTRPLETRIEGLDYASFPQTRGEKEDLQTVNSAEISLAEKYLLEAVINRPNSDSFYALGKLRLAQNNFDKAIDNFKEAFKTNKDNPKLNNDFAVAYLEKGKRNRLIGEDAKATEEFAHSLELLNKSLAGNENLPEALFNRANLYQNMMLTEKAIEDWQKYLEKDSTSKWADEARNQLKILEEKKLNSNLSNEKIFENFQTAYRNQDANLAWQMIKLSRSRTGIFVTDKLIDDFLKQASSNKENAGTNENLKMLNFAGDVAKQSVGDVFLSDIARFYSQLKPSQFEPLTKARLAIKEGQGHYQKSETEGAIAKYTEAKQLYKSVQNSAEESCTDLWIGFCKLRAPQNQLQNEIASFTKLAQLFDKNHYYSLQAQSLQAIADAQSSVSEPSKSFESAQKSLVIAKKNQDIEMILRSYQTISSINSNVGKYNDSISNIFSAFDAAQEFPTRPNVLWAFYSLNAKNFYQLGFRDASFVYQEKAIQLAEEAKIPQLKSRSFEQSALFYMLDGNLEKAVESGEKAIDYSENATSAQLRLNTISRLSLLLGDIYRKSGDYRKALESYQKSQEIYEQLGYKAKLYQIFRGKALTYIALKNDDLAKIQLDEAIKQYDLFRKNIYEESNRNSYFDTEQGIYDVAVNFAYSQLNDNSQALKYSEINRARSLFDLLQTDKLSVEQKAVPEIMLKSMNSPLEISKLQSQIPDNSQILEYTVLENKIISWVVTKDSIKSAETEISDDQLRQKIKAFLDTLNSADEADNSEVKNLAKELYKILITPNEAFLDANKTLFIIPDKELHFLPFSSMINPDTGKYMIEKYTIGISPSLNVFVLNSMKTREKSPDKAEKLLAIGNPVFDKAKHKDLDYLPSAVREATEISRFYEPSSSILLNKDATKSKILEGMANFEVIHFASHAVTDENTPMLSGLVLADSGANDDAMLKAFEIYQQKLPKTRLVVLSACQTGIEHAFRGEGAISLARPFIALGVPVVVASLWKVESEPTTELMINFHRERREKNLNALESLRQAQIKMINSENPVFRQPKSWASFIAIGN